MMNLLICVDEQYYSSGRNRDTAPPESRFTAQLTVVITTDAQVQSLNAQFRKIDAPTDVLSFATQEAYLQCRPTVDFTPRITGVHR